MEIREHSADDLGAYAEVCNAFEVSRTLEVIVQDRGLGGFVLVERPVETPYTKDYDRLERPADWAQRFDLSRWRFFGAWLDGRRVGGAAVACGMSAGVEPERRDELATLWDIRVAPEARRAGVGAALFQAVAAWATGMGCAHLTVETQNVNLPACRFYAAQGCVLEAIHRFAYPALPGEIQLIFCKDLGSAALRVTEPAAFAVATKAGPANRRALLTEYERVRAYYAGFNEWDRLDSDEGRLEFRRAMEILDRHLLSRARVLDLGGGPGRYSIELARRGHSIVLADLSPALLAQARERIAAAGVQANIEGIDEVNAADLSRYSSESFDVVLAFGPFYHLTAEHERVRASREIARVLRCGGLGFVAFMPRISGVVGLIERASRAPEQVSRAALHLAVETGVFHNTSEVGFQEGYYGMHAEIERLLAAAGLETIDTLSLRSVGYRLERALDALAPSMRAEVDAVIASMSRWPDVVASSGHALLIARKP